MDTTTEKAIAEAATAGPWKSGDEPVWETYRIVAPSVVYHLDPDPLDPTYETEVPWPVVDDDGMTPRDVEFIKHARTGYPLALAVVEAAQEWNKGPGMASDAEDRLSAALDAWKAAS
jgi:hypothetical protein